jgi:anthranilate synthase/aminodeoxychorismate synthase-like glutamine amidotransferase
MILLIDNYDSFVHNLARYFQILGQDTVVRRNDSVDTRDIEVLKPSAIVLSPGPCHPADAGCCIDVVRHFQASIPILGVCLGHQAIGAAFGGRIERARYPMHGRASRIRHHGSDVFSGLPNPVQVGRYHSLVLAPESVPSCLEVTATTDDGIIMAIGHRLRPIFGVQFHPESILTECGFAILRNFLELAAIPTADTVSRVIVEPAHAVTPPPHPRHVHPVTF